MPVTVFPSKSRLKHLSSVVERNHVEDSAGVGRSQRIVVEQVEYRTRIGQTSSDDGRGVKALKHYDALVEPCQAVEVADDPCFPDVANA